MATRKEVRNRIASVKNITKITRAMEMVAAARLRRAEQRIAALRPYAQAIRRLTQRAAAQTGDNSPIPREVGREETRNSGILKRTSTRALAGPFNSKRIGAG